MDFELSDERRMLHDTAARFLRERYAIATRHANAALPDGFSRGMWAAFADLGLIGALLPPEVGGFGGLGEDIAVIFEALGRALAVEPFLASGILGASPLALAGSPGQRALLAEVIAGDLTLALAHGEPDARYGLSHVATAATEAGGLWRLNGRKAMAINGDSADRLVVSARVGGAVDAPGGIGLFLLDAAAPGVARRGYGTVEGGRAAEVTLTDAPAEPVGAPGEGFATLELTLARGTLALCAEAVGLMEVCKDATLDYLKTRTQFGRPIGAFQALQHRMVEMVIDIEMTRSAVMLAAGTFEGDRLTRERHVAAAKHLVGRAGRSVAEETIQMHGGIAMTWECPVAHYAKRLVMIDHLLGDADAQLDRFIALGRGDA